MKTMTGHENIHELTIPALLIDEASSLIADANEAALKFYGYTNKEFYEMNIGKLRHADERKKLIEDIETFRDEYSYFGTSRHIKKNGEVVHVRVRANKIEEGEKKFWILKIVQVLPEKNEQEKHK
jgi:PAS domain S-box-containing protein